MHQLNLDYPYSIRRDKGVTHFGGSGEVIGKGGKRRRFCVDEASVVIYAEYVLTRTDNNPALFLSERKQRMSIRAIQETLATLCKRLGAPHINVHRLRHTYATRLANGGINSAVLRDLMGHKSFTTTSGYLKLSDKTLALGYFSAMEYLKG